MKRSVNILLLVGLAFARSISLPQATPEQLENLSKFSRSLNEKVNYIVDAPTTLRTGSQCFEHKDCPTGQSCMNVEGALQDYLTSTSHMHEFNRLKRKARIFGMECVVDTREMVFKYSSEEINSRMIDLVEEMKSILNNSKTGVARYGIDSDRLVIAHLDEETINLPSTRQNAFAAGTSGINPLFLLLALRGNDGGLSLDNNLLLLLFLTQSQQPGAGVDQNFLNNPFLLYVLLGDNSSGSNNNNLLLLLLTLSPNGGLFGGAGGVGGDDDLGDIGTNVLANPLILFTLLGNSNQDNFNNLLLLFAISGGLGGGFGAAPGDAGSGIQSLLPLLLLSGTGTGTNTENLLLILLLSGNAIDPASPDSGINNLIPLLFLTNTTLANDNLIFLLALSGGLGGPNTPDLNDPFGGGLASIIPLLIFTNSSTSLSTGDNDNLLLLLVLSGGIGNLGGPGGTGIQSLLPFLLLQGSGSDNTLLLLLLFSSFSQTPAGLAPFGSAPSA